MLDMAAKLLSEEQIRKFHYLLKINTSDSRKPWFRIGDYKLRRNVVEGNETSLPSNVTADMNNLIETYRNKQKITISDIIDFHSHFEKNTSISGRKRPGGQTDHF